MARQACYSRAARCAVTLGAFATVWSVRCDRQLPWLLCVQEKGFMGYAQRGEIHLEASGLRFQRLQRRGELL